MHGMRLQSQVSREYKGKKYEKFWVVIPTEEIKQLDWKAKEELKLTIEDGRIIIEREVL